jgi:uncharacterized MAPEG superfamily protein
MTLAEFSLLALVIIWLASIGLAKGIGFREYDNARPRASGFYESGWRARALGAHQNAGEAIPFFAAAVLLAEFRAAPQGVVDALAGAFIGLRLVYLAAYLGNQPLARSTIWSLGFLVNIALFLTPLLKG